MAEAPVVVPAVFYRDPLAALHWLEKAFGFETSLLVTGDDGSVGHAEMSFRGGAIGVGGEWASPELLGPAAMKSPVSIGGVGTQFIRIHLSEGLDAHWERPRRRRPDRSGARGPVLWRAHLPRPGSGRPCLELRPAGRAT